MGNGGLASKLTYVRLSASPHAPVLTMQLRAVALAARMRIDATGLNKVLHDDVTASDDVSIEVGKNLADAIAAADGAPLFDVGKSLTDAIAAADSVSLDVGKSLADAIAATDSTSIDTGKVLSDAITASDSAPQFAVGKGLTDAIAATDAAPTFDTGKALTDTITAAESVSIGVTKPLTDAIAATDSGVILKQNYAADPFYFAEDYTGTKTTF